MRSRKHSHFACNLANFVERPSVGPSAAFQNILAEVAFTQALKCARRENRLVLISLRKRIHDLFLDVVDEVIAFFLGMLGGI